MPTSKKLQSPSRLLKKKDLVWQTSLPSSGGWWFCKIPNKEQESVLWIDPPREGISLWTASSVPGGAWVALALFAPGTLWAGPIALPIAKKKAA